MKTIKEAAIERWEKDYGKGNEGHYLYQQSIDMFTTGAEFAKRWIPVEEELPSYPESDNVLWKNQHETWFGSAWQSQKPTHWRPIKIK